MLGYDRDAAELPEASYTVDYAGQIDKDGDEYRDADDEQIRAQIEFEIERRASQKAAQATSFVIHTILGYPNARLALIAFAFAHGLCGISQKTIEQWATELGVTKQALSKVITEFRDMNPGQPAFGALKSDRARDKYSEAQIKRHATLRR